jgi:hypothetical protein
VLSVNTRHQAMTMDGRWRTTLTEVKQASDPPQAVSQCDRTSRGLEPNAQDDHRLVR